jgi:hypothetical protein
MGFLLVVAWGKHTACGQLLPVESRLLTMGPDVAFTNSRHHSDECSTYGVINQPFMSELIR